MRARNLFWIGNRGNFACKAVTDAGRVGQTFHETCRDPLRGNSIETRQNNSEVAVRQKVDGVLLPRFREIAFAASPRADMLTLGSERAWWTLVEMTRTDRFCFAAASRRYSIDNWS